MELWVRVQKNKKIIQGFRGLCIRNARGIIMRITYSEVVYKIIKERKAKEFPVTREVKSYVREIKAHNRLYKLGLFRSHTKDTDLEENITKKKEFIYKIIGR